LFVLFPFFNGVYNGTGQQVEDRDHADDNSSEDQARRRGPTAHDDEA
jgi:hypothetical protein